MPTPTPTTALLTLTPAPPLTHALPWAEALHAALVALSDPAAAGAPSPALTGRDPLGRPQTGHRHASVLPLALATASDDRLEHVLVHAPVGLDAPARAALAAIERVWIKPHAATLHVALAALGLADELAARVPALRASATWTSSTPFVPARHLKVRGSGAIDEQIQAELASRGLPSATSIEIELASEGGRARYASVARFWPLWHPSGAPDADATPEPADGAALTSRWQGFRVERREADRRPPVRAGFGLRLGFAEPVRGPIALGYASHFGLGQLVPA